MENANIDGLVQERCNSSALAMELRLSYTNPSIYFHVFSQNNQLIVAYWRHMAKGILVNIGSGNGLLSDGTKPLPEPMLTNDQWVVVAFTW